MIGNSYYKNDEGYIQLINLIDTIIHYIYNNIMSISNLNYIGVLINKLNDIFLF